MSGISACILGCAGPRLLSQERAFFRTANPWGFILFARNVETPEQLSLLRDLGCDAVQGFLLGRPMAADAVAAAFRAPAGHSAALPVADAAARP